MKIVTKVGNLLDVTSGHIVHGCNAQGVMGSGVALAVKKKYISVYEDYRKRYETTGLELGAAYPVTVTENELVMWNAITQNLYGVGVRQVSYDAIQTCFEHINTIVGQYEGCFPTEIHLPFIGAGLGGGRWNIIKAIIEDTVNYPVTVWSIDGKMPDGSMIDSIQ